MLYSYEYDGIYSVLIALGLCVDYSEVNELWEIQRPISKPCNAISYSSGYLNEVTGA